MIVSRIPEVARKRGIENANQLSVRTGILPTVAHRLWKGEFDKIGIANLDKLCAGLNSSSGELLEYVPEKGKAVTGKTDKSRARRKA